MADADDADGPHARIAADPTDRPYVRPEHDAFWRPALLALVAAAMLGALVWYVIEARDARAPAASVPQDTAGAPAARPAGQPAIQRAIAPIVVGLIATGGYVLATPGAPDWRLWVIALACAAATLLTKMNPLWFLAAGGVTGGALL